MAEPFDQTQDYKEYIKEHILEYLPEDYADARVLLDSYMRKEDERVTGLTILRKDEVGAPRIFLEQYTDRLVAGEPIEDIMREIADFRVRFKIPEGPEQAVQQIFDYDATRTRFSTRLYDAEGNAEYLQNKIWRPLGTLAMVVRIEFAHQGHNIFATTVDEEIRALWDVSDDQLFADAIENDRSLHPVQFFNVRDHAFRPMPPGGMEDWAKSVHNLYGDTEPVRRVPGQAAMYVLTNRRRINGAAVIGWPGVLEHVAELLDGSFYVLPTSTDECMVVKDGEISFRQLRSMLRTTNIETTTPDDLLSYTVHHYDWGTGVFEAAKRPGAGR